MADRYFIGIVIFILFLGFVALWHGDRKEDQRREAVCKMKWRQTKTAEDTISMLSTNYPYACSIPKELK